LPRTKTFFDDHHADVARKLLGCTLIWDGVGGVIVETEAYAAKDDPACHTSFRPSARAFFETHSPGTVYVYMNYGVHWLLNVLARDGIILIRALQPTLGIDLIRQRRRQPADTDLCSGPGKVGQAIALSGSDHGTSLLTETRHVLSRDDQFDAGKILTDVRVGLSTGLDRPWRFLLAGNAHVSIPHGKAIAKKRPARRV
jgi:DNA-3-methyladenine glycosylase